MNKRMKNLISSQQCEQLAQALRLELQEYGGLLNLFKEQQKGITHHDMELLIELNDEITDQVERANSLRVEREQVSMLLCEQVSLEPNSLLIDLLEFVPSQFEPMLHALIEEVNDLIGSISMKIRQNNLLAARAQEIVEQILSHAEPTVVTKTYTPKGSIAARKSTAGHCVKASA